MKFSNYSTEINAKLEDYKNLVLSENEKMNLTAITDEKEFIEKHFYDSLLPTECVNFNNKSVLDIGSGAGFPGIPLAILYGNTKFTLLEPMQKRCNFLSDVINKLHLENVKVICKRAEDITENEREKYDIVVSRAVSSLPILLEICTPYLKNGGSFISYKGLKYQDEIDMSKSALKSLNCHVAFVQMRKLPITKEERFNIIIKKDKNTPRKFPRNFSQIKKKPL
jgi:16S rRNA (guanine527-N7)-methyltransferase